ncbi:ABC transporter ATP-binding protein [Spiroplasma endosymbiont of Labia minor]|uniref:ABC transporter ATP-binding protein n=1 Tax=Spiroplasma endosymbiont of Labia minor TaxID=3066305 RepID=UPI0030D553AA
MLKINYAVEMIDITKIFNKTIIANNKINFRVKKGTVHALVGENGAGKSTLMSILFGLYEPTEGYIKINDEQVNISNPIKANKLGIGMVHQHFKLIDNDYVWQNISLGAEITTAKIFVNQFAIKRKIRQIMNEYNLFVNLDAKIENISVGMQQRVEILKILYRGANIMVLDEPTAVLTPQEIQGLLNNIRDLRKRGKTIIFITHKLDEITAVADSVTVIRNGQNVKDFDVKELTEEKLAEAIVGRNLVEVKNKLTKPGPDILYIDNISVKKEGSKVYGLENFSALINRGEILAIAGVEGNGQTELIEALSGMKKISSGNIFFKDVKITNKSINERYKMGINHIPEDRHKYGLILDYSAINNTVLQNISQKPFSFFSLLNFTEIENYGRKIIKEFDVRGTRNGIALARGLSGGNQQKLIVGREMTRNYDLLLIVQPTRGLDVGAIEYMHKQILKAKDDNKAILLVSYELDEVMSLADRIIILSRGKITGEISAKNARREEIGKLMAAKGMKQYEF